MARTGKGATSPSGRRETKKTTTRRRLILAGRRLFSDVGLYEARIEDLTEIAGVAKGTMYLYFRNKDDLVRAVIAAGYEELSASIRECASGENSFRVLLGRIVRTYARFFSENPDMMRIFHQARGMLKFDRPEWRSFRAPLREHVSVLSETLRQAPSDLKRRDAARWNAALAIFGCVSGIASVQTALEPRQARRAFQRALVSRLSSLTASSYLSPRMRGRAV
ncbi:MAG TPA: TetR/AcrR family transcriptional regulator [Candidatus Eisenbacteria bacterium]